MNKLAFVGKMFLQACQAKALILLGRGNFQIHLQKETMCWEDKLSP